MWYSMSLLGVESPHGNSTHYDNSGALSLLQQFTRQILPTTEVLPPSSSAYLSPRTSISVGTLTIIIRDIGHPMYFQTVNTRSMTNCEISKA